jgi:hypothetical protein
MKLAPIVIFSYKRLNLLKKLVNSLKKNKLSQKSILYIFSDGPKSLKDGKQVIKVRKYIKKITGFKKKIYIFRKRNLGLAHNIIDGNNKIFNKFDRAIILEDDLEVSNKFIEFMNLALIKYKNKKKVWHISSWNYKLNIKNYKNDAYFWRCMNCWGWASWANRWKNFNNNINDYQKWNKQKIKKFNLDNHINFWSQIKRNKEKKINTWAIFWYATIFKNKGLCLNPINSLSKNNGYDKFAEHWSSNLPLSITNVNINDDSYQWKNNLPSLIREDKFIIEKIKNVTKKKFFNVLFNKLFRKNKFFIL